MKQAKRQGKKEPKGFRELLEKYLDIKGLDIVVVMEDGTEIELYKNRELTKDMIITLEKGKEEKRIPIKDIKTVDMFAA